MRGGEMIVTEVNKQAFQRAFARRYKTVKKWREKSLLLTEFCVLSGYHRKYAIALLRAGPLPQKPPRSHPPAKRRYGPAIIKLLICIWEVADYPWSVRLAAVIFAIRDYLGNLVATGSRYLHPRTPKEKAFSKGMIKLGAFQTPGALESETIGITEVPIDAITLALCGLPSVATLGTNNIAKPWPHIRAHRIILALDGDESGNRAADALRLELGPARCVRFHFPEGITDTNGFLCTDERAFRLHIGSLLENPSASD
jgi:hypothetical protein